jgi:Ca-activated chloride channel family protein
VRYTYSDVRLRTSGGAEFIPRLWATRKIGYLLTQIELHGANRELVDEVIALSVRYGIITPYTSFLIDETEDALSAEGRGRLAERELPALAPQADGRGGGVGGGGAGAPAAPSASGQAAVEKSIVQNTLRQADMAATPQAGEAMRVVGNRTFVQRGEVWTDTGYDAASMAVEQVPFGSARYLELARASSEWARYASLGERVLLVWEGRAYEVTAAPLGALATLWPTVAPTAEPSRTTAATSATTAEPVGTAEPGPTPQPFPSPTPSTLWDLVWGWLRAIVK